jgi:hypothetical protein
LVTRAASTFALAVFISMMPACKASERQRPLGLDDITKGAGSLEALRRELQGTWELVALESSPEPGRPRVPINATGTLVYDEYANFTIEARTTDPAAPVAAREKALLSFKGRAAIDPVRKELRLMDLTGNADPTEVLAPERRRRFEISADTLTLSSLDGNEITAISTWHRRR